MASRVTLGERAVCIGRGIAAAVECVRSRRTSIVADVRFAPLVMFAFGMMLFGWARVVLLAAYPSEFGALGWGQVLYAFVKGALFDAAVLLVFTGLPLVLMTLPFRFAARRWYRGVFGWYTCGVLVVMAFALAADIVYFEEVHRHAGVETWAVGNDIRIVVAFALKEALFPLLAFFVIAGGIVHFWRALLGVRVEPPRRALRAGAISVGLLLAVVLTVRGGVTSKPLSIADAFEGVTVECGKLILNGPYSLAQSLNASYYVDIDRLPRSEAEAELRASLHSRHEEFVDDAFPLLRRRAVEGTSRPNVVVILLESWSADAVDCLRRAEGLEAYGATPAFDDLASRGVLFLRFYSAGQRSISAMAAILTGLPTLPGMPFLGVGMELNELCYLGRIAKAHGYATHFLQGSPRMSFKCDAISSIAGFDAYYGEEDIPRVGESDHAHAMGAWDYDLFMKADSVFADSPKPFLGFVFTLSTHRPNDVPTARYTRFDRGTKLGLFLNSLAYADQALGEFFRRAREHGYYEDTVFIITADHTFFRTEATGDETDQFHVPLLILAPAVSPAVSGKVATHADILPTAMDLAGWSAPHASCGRSLLEDDGDDRRFAVCTKGRMVLRIEEGGWILNDLTARRRASPGTGREALDAIERRLYGLCQTLTNAMRQNRVYRPAEVERP
jgi:phosphoglycerol transferase MdoB-like AlkP superfamily enzyme